MEILGFLWNEVLLNPMTNILIVLNNVLFGNFGLAIIVFTIIMRGITFPMTLRQLRSSRAMSALQPKLQELQKKHKDPKRRSEEQMKLFREAGVNPLGCLAQMLVQMPIWFALYQTIRLTLGSTPESLISLSHRLYPWAYIQHAVPLSERFLWLDLGKPDLLLALLTGVLMFVQQKITMAPAADERTRSMNSTMLWMMPLMFAYISITVPSGLPLYWVVSSMVSIVLQYVYVGSGGVTWRNLFSLQPVPAQRPATPVEKPATEEESDEEGVIEGSPASRRFKKRSRHGKRRRKR